LFKPNGYYRFLMMERSDLVVTFIKRGQ